MKLPATFTEAIKAYGESQTIICEIDGNTIRYTPIQGNHLINNKGYRINGITSYEILEGKWYIESEVE